MRAKCRDQRCWSLGPLSGMSSVAGPPSRRSARSCSDAAITASSVATSATWLSRDSRMSSSACARNARARSCEEMTGFTTQTTQLQQCRRRPVPRSDRGQAMTQMHGIWLGFGALPRAKRVRQVLCATASRGNCAGTIVDRALCNARLKLRSSAAAASLRIGRSNGRDACEGIPIWRNMRHGCAGRDI